MLRRILCVHYSQTSSKRPSAGQFFASKTILTTPFGMRQHKPNSIFLQNPNCRIWEFNSGFNLFAELKYDLDLASNVFKQVSRGHLSEVLAIEFEWSPGKNDEKYTGDKSAFDVYVRYRDVDNRPGFFGIEVKYHENLESEDLADHPRYLEIANQMACFRSDRIDRLQGPGRFVQMWRNHLLVGAHKIVDGFQHATFVFLYPEVNTDCALAASEYRQYLKDQSSFHALTMDTFVACLMFNSDASWIRKFYERYLDFGRLPPH